MKSRGKRASPPISSPAEIAPSAVGAAFPIVGIGASAGGLEALTQLLKALPRDTGMGFVIVQHLSPAHPSSLAEILARATKMPVCEVRDEPEVEPDHVYVIPPGRDMIVAGGKLRLLPQERHAQHRGIDHFFRSLAEDSGQQAIGVILSGGATDGTLGLEVIKAEGGVTFAQDESAQHDSMPQSAVASGCVDFVLPPEGIAREIARIARHPYVAAPPEDGGGGEEGVGHGPIAEIVRRATGVDFTHYKANTMQRRIERRMMVHKIETLAEYEEHLRTMPGEIETLYQDVLINVTSFFRNPEAFETLAKGIFPKLLAGRSRSDPVRMWTLGCSTGEEAYSLAMLFAEGAEAAKCSAHLQIFASDLNASCIERARVGRYPRSIAQDVSPERLRKFFVEEDGHYRVNKSVRECIVFSQHNVLVDPPFSRVDFISCRNLLIYFEPVLQEQVMSLLHYALKPGGHLWLGHAESPGTSRELFEVEDARQKIFTRRPGPTPLVSSLRQAGSTAIFPVAAPNPRETPQTMLHRDAERVLLAKYAPPGVVVNARLEVVQFRGETGAYLAPAAGLASHEILKMLREGLLVPVRAALARAESEGGPVREQGARVKADGGHRELAIEVIPLKAGPWREAGFVILFDEGTASRADEIPRPKSAIPNEDDEIARLTQELAATRAYLQSVIEQQDAANEELQSANEEAQSANEEMQSVNEELQTSKEEIESSSEELQTVNDELNHRNVELSGLNNDLNNVLVSTRLSIVIVARDLRIRRFTAVAEHTLHLTGSDLGRPLGDIKLSIALPELGPLLREVIDTISPRERDVQDAEGRWFSLRARPYLTHDNKIDGAVVTLVDVDELRRARLYAEDLLANAPVPVVVLDSALRVKTASRAFFETYHVAPSETVDRPIYELGNRQWDIPTLRTLLEEVLPREQVIKDFEVRHTFEEIGARIMRLNARRLAQAAENEPLIILSIEDITAREQTRQAFAERSRLLDLTNDAIMVRDMEGRIAFWNAGAEKLYGWPREEALGKISHALLKTECAEPFEQITEVLLRDGHWTGEFIHSKRDGGRIAVLARKSLDRDSQGNPTAILVTLTDITERKRVETALGQSEQRFRTAVSTVSSLIWTNNAEGKMKGVQPGWGNFTGQTMEEYQDYGWAKAVHPEDAQRTVDAWNQAVAAKRMFEFQHRLRRADGEWRICSIRAAPVLAEGGAVVEWVGVHTDITDQKRSEEILRQSEERYRALINASSDVVYRMSADWGELGPLDGRGLVGSSAAPSRTWLEDNFFPEDRPQVRAAFQEAIRTKGVFNLEHRVRRADGTPGWTVSRAVPVCDAHGEIVEWFGTASDVTERRQAEKALRESEERYRSIIDSSPDCIKVLDLEGRLLSVEAGHELLGITDVTPLLGKSWLEFWLRPEDHAAARGAVAAAAGSGEGHFVGFFRTLLGEDKWWDVAITLIRDGSGQPARLLAVSRDVTERKLAEEVVRQLNSNLERRVAERTVELEKIAAELTQTSRYKSEFLANMSHELRTPLNSLLILSRTLADNKAGNLTAPQIEWARTIHGAGTDLLKLIDEVLDLSRIEAGKANMEVEDVPLASVRDLTERTFRPVAEERQLDFTLTLDPGLPNRLRTDAHRLQQILRNLLANAFKFTRQGGVTLTIAPALHGWSPDHERLNGAPRVIAFAVRDTGIGIPPDKQSIIFDAFRQAESGTARQYGGTGLGLAISRDIARLLGGTIRVESKPGIGSTFTLYLPDEATPGGLSEETPLFLPRVGADLPVTPDVSAGVLRGCKVLVVDDDARNIFALTSLLENHEMEVLTATGGRAAIDIVKKTTELSLVLMDIMMPGMDGYETMKEIRQSPELRTLPIVALTAKAMKGDREKCLDAGASDYISKPVNTDDLLSLIKKWLPR